MVLAQGVATLDAYRSARRVGRGVVLSRAKRDAIWPVFEEYRAQLASRRLNRSSGFLMVAEGKRESEMGS